MFGQNPVRPQVLDPEGMLWVQEIFPTIQGEGPNAGISSLFIRLAGCNLKCWFCDTDFESKRSLYSVKDLYGAALVNANAPCHLIVLTGGEPFLQNITPFIERAAKDNWTVQIETAGTLWVTGLERFLLSGVVQLVCSPKTGKVHSQIERYCKHYKYILRASEPLASDGLPFVLTQHKFDKDNPKTQNATKLYRPDDGRTIWVQPCDEQDEYYNRQNRELCAKLVMLHDYRLSLQQHKILNLP